MAAGHPKAKKSPAYPKHLLSAPKKASRIIIINNQRDVSISLASVRSVVKEFLSLAKIQTNEVSVYFVTEKKITELHKEFFNDPTPTDCITFPMDDEAELGYHILGEIFISPKAAISFVQKKGISSQKEIYKELTLYLVHGLLHLSGYDDIEKKQRLQMRRLEKKYMAALSSYISRKKVLTE